MQRTPAPGGGQPPRANHSRRVLEGILRAATAGSKLRSTAAVAAPDPFVRDYVGYGEHPPKHSWPGGAKVAVSVVVNIEEGSERRTTRGDAANEPVYDMFESMDDYPNLTMESHFDYGPRAGYWRLVRLLDNYQVSATLNTCAEVLALQPWLGKDAISRGHEISCHGLRWAAPKGLDEAEERAMIAEAATTIEQHCDGVRPVGWHCRCPHTPNTRRLLLEEGGFLYDSDAYDDDLPRVLELGVGRRHVVLPYSLDTNDMRYQLSHAGFPTAEQFSRYIIDAFDWLSDEANQTGVPKMMSIGLHPRVVGRCATLAVGGTVVS
eukprot:SAG22_NODE_1476_length_4329_cov_2.702128_3_plen_321_part_00